MNMQRHDVRNTRSIRRFSAGTANPAAGGLCVTRVIECTVLWAAPLALFDALLVASRTNAQQRSLERRLTGTSNDDFAGVPTLQWLKYWTRPCVR